MDTSSLIAELMRMAGGSGQLPPPLNPPAATGTPDDMEARAARLEAHVEHIASDLTKLADVPVRLAVLEERVSHLPTKAWMATALGGGLALIAALVAFADQIRAFLQ